MSITSRINEMSSHIEQAYDELQGLGADLTNVNKNIENISMVLDDIYDSMPQVSGEGTSLTLDDTRVGKIKSTLKGNTSQSGTPTPTTPIPVNVVSGDNEIIIKGNGKNLFNKDFHIVNGSFISGSGGIASDSTLSYQDYFIEVEQNTEYTISSSTSTIYRIAKYNSSKTFIDRPYNENASTSYTINTGNAKYIKMAGTLTTVLNSLQIEKGSSASTYEPYQGNTYNIDLPVENLFDKGNANVLNAYLSSTKVESSDITRLIYIECKPNTTYTISKIKTARFRVATTANVPAGNEPVIDYAIDDTSTSLTITTSSTSKYLCSFIYHGTYDTTITLQQVLDSIQIEVGSKANSYTPYGTTPIELCKIGNYQDYFYKDSDKWYLHKEIGKAVLNGSENWTLDNGANPFYLANIISKLKAPTNTGVGTALCNKYVSTNIFSANTNKGFIILSNGTTLTNCRIREESMGTVEAFKTSLQNNNAIIYSIIATPTNTEITYQPLIDQLNLLEKAMSKDGQTNISQVNNDLPFIISASALKEWQESTSLNSTLSMVNPLSLGNTLNTQENDIQPIEVDNIEPLEEEENEES